VTAQGALIEQLEWTRGGALIGAGSRRTGPDTYDSPLFVWPSARGEAVEVVKDAVSFHAAHRHPDLFAAFDCR
jgi:hypothetical protein